MSQRIEYYDFLRGIAIIMVVGIHTFIPLSMDSIAGYISAFVRQILNCAVPIFLALSGYLLGTKPLEDKDARLIFWKKQISKVYIPALLWSVPYFVMSIIPISSRGGESVGLRIVTFLVCGYSIYYFIALIVQYYLLLPLLQKNKSALLPISAVISLVSISLITYIIAIHDVSLPLIVYAGPFITWFVFFMLGVYYSSSKINYTIKQAIAVTVVGFFIECIETYWLNTSYGGGYGIKLSAFIYSIGIILLILSPEAKTAYKSNKFTYIIAYIGNISFGVYLIHCFVIKLVNYILPASSWVISWSLVVIITLLIIVAARKLLPYNLRKYLGFS